jgi:hypothetical protein
MILLLVSNGAYSIRVESVRFGPNKARSQPSHIRFSPLDREQIGPLSPFSG